MKVDAPQDWLANPRGSSKQGTTPDSCAAYHAGYGVTPGILLYESGAREESGCGAKTRYSGRVNRLRGFRESGQNSCPYPTWRPVHLPLPMDRPGSISNRQLSRVQTPAANEEG